MGAARTAIVLIGLRRSGKTSLGRRLAAARGAEFVDLDALVQQESGRSAAEWLRSASVEAFRCEEERVLRGLLARAVCASTPPLVFATGGGTPTHAASAALLRQLGHVVYLELSADEAVRRAQADPDSAGRPLLCGADAAEEARLLHAARGTQYRALADVVVAADGAPDAVFTALQSAF